MAQRYEKQRQLYNKQVSALRKQYAEEISTQKALEQAKQAKERQEILLKKQERQRAKNLRSIENAKRDIAEKAERAKEFEKELEMQQIKRETRNDLFRKARMLFLEELEEESVHWMTSPEEVEEQLGGWEAEQLLWSTPYLIGVVPEDATFWRYQTHTQPRNRRLQSPKEYILEKLEEYIFIQSNFDSNFWTPERRRDVIQWQEKAKLRALVQNRGRAILLQKQYRMLQEEYLQNAPNMQIKGNRYDRSIIRPQKKIPAPSLEILANESAQEKEGAKLLMEDPSKFFVFNSTTTTNNSNNSNNSNNNNNNNNDTDTIASKSTTVLGKPISLKHEFGPKGNSEPYPLLLAKDIQTQNLTQKEKKRAQKEDERLAKLRESMEVEQGGVDFEHDSGPPADIEWDDEDKAWEEQMMQKYGQNGGITLEELRQIPMEERLSEEDIDWITNQLQSKFDSLDAVTNEDEEDDEVHRVKKQVSVILSKLNDEQRDAVGDLDLSVMITSQDKDDYELMKVIQECIGSDTLSKDDLKFMIDIERRLVQDEDFKTKLMQ